MAIAQQLLALVPAIYDAAIDPAQWASVLERLTTAFGGHCATMMQGLGEGDAQFITHGYSPDILRDCYAPVAASNMFAHSALHAPTGTVESDRNILDKTEFRASEFYNEFLIKHLNADAVLTGMMWRGGTGIVALNICRDRRGGDFESADAGGLRLLMPHLTRAITIGRRLNSLDSSAASAREALDRALCGAIVTDAEGRILYANRPGEVLLREGDAIAASADGLRAATPALTAKLRATVAKAAEGKGGAVALARPAKARAVYAVAAPLRAEFGWLRPAAGRVLLTLRDPLRVTPFPPEYLREIFGLTSAEARLATHMQRGKSPAQIANALGISSHTVRVHLNALMSKTGTHRQAELVRLLMGLPPVPRT